MRQFRCFLYVWLACAGTCLADATGEPTVLTYGTYQWYVIVRGEKYGIRLKDTANPNRLTDDDEWFVIFSDETSGHETYGAGRFLSVDRPDSSGITFIDFNKAYNPPCAFTEFATCPLPPAQNKLSVPILAGERAYGVH
jgi:uncharacterized protein (DUF1684 family)